MGDEYLKTKLQSKYVCRLWNMMSPGAGCREIMQLYLLIFPQTVVKLDHLQKSNRQENRNRF